DPHDFLAFLDRKEAWAHAWDLVPTAVETLLALRRLAEAEALAARHATGIEGRDAPGAVAEHHLCRGLLLRAADPDAAMAAFDLAAARWTDIGRPYPAALAAERAARTRTDLDDVSVRLAAPIAAFERLGATSDAARCHRVLRELGKVTSNPRGRAGYGDRHTPVMFFAVLQEGRWPPGPGMTVSPCRRDDLGGGVTGPGGVVGDADERSGH
ncbi:hypothetical protein PUR61_29415, partial [Streptomyces sp. BE20]|nr:hypothetical protein [Streptomyces sp. BE20]